MCLDKSIQLNIDYKERLLLPLVFQREHCRPKNLTVKTILSDTNEFNAFISNKILIFLFKKPLVLIKLKSS